MPEHLFDQNKQPPQQQEAAAETEPSGSNLAAPEEPEEDEEEPELPIPAANNDNAGTPTATKRGAKAKIKSHFQTLKDAVMNAKDDLIAKLSLARMSLTQQAVAGLAVSKTAADKLSQKTAQIHKNLPAPKMPSKSAVLANIRQHRANIPRR